MNQFSPISTKNNIFHPACHPYAVINCLFRNIPIPDYHNCAKPEISPNDGKHKYVSPQNQWR